MSGQTTQADNRLDRRVDIGLWLCDAHPSHEQNQHRAAEEHLARLCRQML